MVKSETKKALKKIKYLSFQTYFLVSVGSQPDVRDQVVAFLRREAFASEDWDTWNVVGALGNVE